MFKGSNASFDLRQSPFYLLGTAPDVKAADIIAACDDAVAGGRVNALDAQAARQALLTPKLRVEAELSYLWSLPLAKAVPLMNAGLTPQAIDEALSGTGTAVMLDRSNLLAHMGAKRAFTTQDFLALLRAQSAVGIGDLLDLFNDERQGAGIVPVEATLIEEAWTPHCERQLIAAMASVKNYARLATWVSDAVTQIIDGRDPRAQSMLDAMGRIYALRVEPELSRHRESVLQALDRIKSEPGNHVRHIDALKIAIKEWAKYARPLQLIEKAKERDEPRSRELFSPIRSTCLWLVNTHGVRAPARDAYRVLQDAFGDLPLVSRFIADDMVAIEKLAGQPHEAVQSTVPESPGTAQNGQLRVAPRFSRKLGLLAAAAACVAILCTGLVLQGFFARVVHAPAVPALVANVVPPAAEAKNAAAVPEKAEAQRAQEPAKGVDQSVEPAHQGQSFIGTLDPQNKYDAATIHRRLSELGYYTGEIYAPWGAASREAVAAYKASQRMPANGEWDAFSEASLFSVSRKPYEGFWGISPAACTAREGNSDMNATMIISNGARGGSTTCRFNSVEQEGASWKIAANCTSVRGGAWKSDIRLDVDHDRLTWDNQKTTVTFQRCLRSE